MYKNKNQILISLLQRIFKKPDFKEYQNRLQCLVNQYSSQVDTKINKNLDGKWTLDENFSDNAGLKASYQAYMKHLEKNGDTKMSGYEKYTNEQSFFISHGTVSWEISKFKEILL